MREGVSIVFDDDGLGIYRFTENAEMILMHRVYTSTLRQMTLADLEYCLCTNALIELAPLREVFADYLWTQDGEVAPRLDKHAPRTM